MRTRRLFAIAVPMALVVILVSVTHVAAAKQTRGLDGQVRSLNFSKSVPGQLNYQGFLADAADSSAVTATLEMTFRLFDSETKGTELWTELHPAVEVNNGLFHVLLGEINPFPEGLFDDSARWLQTEVGTEVLVPRKPLVSVAYSQRSQTADHAGSAEWAGHAEHATHADTAGYSPAANLWMVSGDDIYRETGKVGIGTTSPLTEMDVNGAVNATTYYGDGSNLTGISGTTDNDWTISGDTVYHQTGPVGIGTSDPEMLLDVSGGTTRLAGGLIVGPAGYGVPGIHIYDDDVGPSIRFTNATGMNSRSSISFMDTSDFLWSIGNDIYADGGHTFGIMDAKATEYRVFIDSAGKVGIGTLMPSRALDVAGDVNAITYYGDGSNLTGITGTTDNDWTISGSNVYHEVGNVGIGTTAPQRQLHIKGANPRILIEASSSSPEVNFTNSDDVGTETWALYKHGTTDDFRFYQGGDKMTIQNSTGNVGIGTTSPATELHLASQGNTEFRMTNDDVKNSISFYQSTSKTGFIEKDDAGGKLNLSANGSSTHLTILEVNGTVGIGTASPSTGNKLEVSGGSSYNISTSWSGLGGGAAISAVNAGTAGDAIQVTATGSGRSALWARGASGVDYAIYSAANGATYAGYFSGDLHFTGTMTGGTKSFLIDHPLDPLNKTLMHYCIESPEPLLVYSGKARTGSDGRAVVQMPDYFVALTREDQARINLTPVGRPFLTGAEWNAGNTSFTVYGIPDREVFYTVYADRDDPVMRQLGRPVVEEKGPDNDLCDRGELLYPTAYGYPESMGRDYKERETADKSDSQ